MEENILGKPVGAIGEFVVGTVLPYASVINADILDQEGWLYCDGSLISRSRYADLFAVIGTLHGAGNGTDTFNLPDYRGRFQRGVDDKTGRDPDAANRLPANTGGNPGDVCGSIEGYATATPHTSFTMTNEGEHTHTVDHVPKDKSSYAVAGGAQSIWNNDAADTNEAGAHTHTIVDGDKETRPINAYVNFIIKYRI